MKHNKGFTLIELIVSISLILLLFTIVVPSSVKLVQNSNKKHCQSIVDELLTAADLYAIDRNIKPEFNSSETIILRTLYDEGYIEKEYDFKNGYIISEGKLNTGSGNIEVTRVTDDSDEEGKRGYNTYELKINGKSNYSICD